MSAVPEAAAGDASASPDPPPKRPPAITTTTSASSSSSAPPSPPPPPPPSPPTTLSLVTLNCWGLAYVSSLRAARLREIGRRLTTLSPPPHIVCLQECWVEADFEAVRAATAALLPHARLFRAGALGAGLAVLSRWPFEETAMEAFALNGRPTAFWRGDWYVGKGVACAAFRVGPGDGDVVHVFNTHTHAPYGDDASYRCHRLAQAWHVARLLRAAAARHDAGLVVALGDFNMLPCSLAHRVVTGRAPVRDVWRVLRPDSAAVDTAATTSAAAAVPPSARASLLHHGATSDGLLNTWRWPRARQRRLRRGLPCPPVDADAPDARAKRIDYVFASAPRAHAHRRRRPRPWLVHSAAVALTEPHPRLGVSLSDHFAVHAVLRRHDPADADPADADPAAEAQLGRLPDDDDDGLAPADYDEILSTIAAYVARERRQRRCRALHFCAALAVWLACAVAVYFSPRPFVALLLLLLASLALAAGVVDGLLALLFFSSELRSLDEFAWEVRNAKRAAAARPLKQE